METEKELNAAKEKAITKVYEKIAETGMVTQNQLYNTQLATSIVNSLRPYPVPAYSVANPYAAQTA